MAIFQVFTDGGAYAKGKKEDCKFRSFSSFRFFNEDKELIHEDVEHCEEGTSPFAEIRAIANALTNIVDYMEETKGEGFEVKLYTDSMLCYNSLTQWIFSWIKKAKKGIFYSSTGEPVVNQEEIKRAFEALTKLRKKGKVTFFHINSHTAKKNVKKLKEKFEKFNKVKLTDEEFLFLYLQNAKCDEMIKEAYEKFVGSNKPKNNILERLKEEI